MTSTASTNGSSTNGSSKRSPLIALSPAVDISSVSKIGMAAYRAPSLLQPHRMREAMQDAHHGRIPPLVGFFCGLSAPPMVKFIAQLGFDVVALDWEHAATNVETMTQMVHDVQFFSEGKTIALVRVQGHDHASIGNALDAGASIMVPQVETVEQAQHIVSATKFGASIKGNRSAPPCRFVMGVSDNPIDASMTLHQNLNRQAALTIQIESLQAIQNLDAILTAVGEHIDCVWLGSLDARVSMGLPGFGGGEPEWEDALKLYNETITKHDMPTGGFVFGPTKEIRDSIAKGKSWISPSADMLALMGTMGELAAARQEYPARSQVGALAVGN